MFYPDFDSSCSVCGSSPCVVVQGHVMPQTQLCGPHFFDDHEMTDWSLWNETYSYHIEDIN